MKPFAHRVEALPKCQYLFGGNSLGQNLIPLWKRGQHFIFPVHELLESHGECSVPRGRCVEREVRARRWASELVSSVPCGVDSGVASVCSPVSKRKHAAALRTTMRPPHRHQVPGRMRGEEPLAAPLQRSLTQSRESFFLSSLVFSSLLRLWQEKNK